MGKIAFLLATTSMFMAGCASDNGDPHTDEDPGGHACEVFGSPGTRVTATVDPADAPEIDADETPYTIELVDGAAGFVTLRGGSDALLFVEEENVVTGLVHEDDLDTDLLPAGTPNEFCENDIPEHFDLELEEAGHYHLQLGPSALGEVWVVFLGAEGHAHEEE